VLDVYPWNISSTLGLMVYSILVLKRSRLLRATPCVFRYEMCPRHAVPGRPCGEMELDHVLLVLVSWEGISNKQIGRKEERAFRLGNEMAGVVMKQHVPEIQSARGLAVQNLCLIGFDI
jgi:hypothetical protein